LDRERLAEGKRTGEGGKKEQTSHTHRASHMIRDPAGYRAADSGANGEARLSCPTVRALANSSEGGKSA
jgi:hypothetical protein